MLPLIQNALGVAKMLPPVRSLLGGLGLGNSSQSRADSVFSLGAGDQVELSDSARSLSSVLDMLKRGSTDLINGKYQSIDTVGQLFQEDLAAYRQLLGPILQQAGVGLEGLTLQPDGEGHIRVVGEHPQMGKVNELFEGSPELVSRFMVMAARAALTDAAATEPGFADAYAADPAAAIKKHIGALKDRLLGFQLKPEGWETGFAA